MNGFLLPVAPKAGPCLVDNRPAVPHCPPADCWYGGVARARIVDGAGFVALCPMWPLASRRIIYCGSLGRKGVRSVTMPTMWRLTRGTQGLPGLCKNTPNSERTPL